MQNAPDTPNLIKDQSVSLMRCFGDPMRSLYLHMKNIGGPWTVQVKTLAAKQSASIDWRQCGPRLEFR
jgi:hypothetical protein